LAPRAATTPPGFRRRARPSSGATSTTICGTSAAKRSRGQPARHRRRRRASEGPIAERFAALAELQRQGLIRHLGLSNVTSAQVKEARGIADVVCVQNHYNLVHRADDALLDELAAAGIAFVPFFPLGGFTPLQSSALSTIASELGATPMQTALAWLLHRAPNLLLIPGTSSRTHLRENLAAAALTLSEKGMARLDAIGRAEDEGTADAA
jgi:aryl-alcohol dehydrogenase-like predicted oxidoreductase